MAWGLHHMKRIWTYLLSGALTMALATPAMARGHGSHDRSVRHESRRDGGHDARYREYRHAKWNDRDDRRTGWERGKKTGWHGGSRPPGQARRINDHDRDDWARNRRHHRRHHHASFVRNNRGPVVTPVAVRPNRPAPHQPIATTTIAQKPSGHGDMVSTR